MNQGSIVLSKSDSFSKIIQNYSGGIDVAACSFSCLHSSNNAFPEHCRTCV